MLVEFAGLPGSGKTTIVRSFAKATGIRTAVAQPSPRRELGSSGVRWVDCLTNAAALAKWHDAHRVVFRLARVRALQDQLIWGNDSLLLEEGIVHHCWRELFLHPAPDSARAVASFGSCVFRVSYPLVVFAVDDAERHRRIRGKVYSGPVNKALASTHPDGADWLRSKTLFQRVLDEASRYRDVITVESTGSPEESTDRLARVLQSLS